MSNPTGKGGFQERKHQINRLGRPKSFDALRELAQQIAHETAQAGGADVVVNGHKVTVSEAILRQWAMSKNPQLQRAFIEVAYGKVPDNLDITSGGNPLKGYVSISPDDWAEQDKDHSDL